MGSRGGAPIWIIRNGENLLNLALDATEEERHEISKPECGYDPWEKDLGAYSQVQRLPLESLRDRRHPGG